MIYYSKAVSVIHPRLATEYGFSNRQEQYWALWHSKDPKVRPIMNKHKNCFFASLFLLPLIALCMFNAPPPRIN
jgi:hypothetical protein